MTFGVQDCVLKGTRITNHQQIAVSTETLFYLCNVQNPVAPEDLLFIRQILYSLAKLFSSSRDPKAAETLTVLKHYTCGFLQSA